MKGAKGKRPAVQWYHKDWLSDKKLQRASSSTRGIWINLLMYMLDDDGQEGIIENLDIRQISQLGGSTIQEAEEFIQEANLFGFCNTNLVDEFNITISSRRLIKDSKVRKGARKRKQRQRDKGGGDPDNWAAIRVKILQRDKYMCGYCGRKADTVDHITPKSKGGTEDDYNLVACCKRCNMKKSNRTLEGAGFTFWPGFDISVIDIHTNVTPNSQQVHTNTPTPTPIPTSKEVKKTKAKKVPVHIPDIFPITGKMKSWFNKQDFKNIKIEPETDRFIDYWKSNGNKKADWIATWRNGMRNAEKWAGEKKGDDNSWRA